MSRCPCPAEVAGEEVRDVGADPECAESSVALDAEAESVTESAGEAERTDEPVGRPRPMVCSPPPVLEAGRELLVLSPPVALAPLVEPVGH